MKSITTLMFLCALGVTSAVQAVCPTNDNVLSPELRAAAGAFSPQPDANVSTQLMSQFVSNGCFGGDADQNAFSKRVLQKALAMKGQSAEPLEVKTQAEALLAELAARGGEQLRRATYADIIALWGAYVQQVNNPALLLKLSEADFGVRDSTLMTPVLDTFDGRGILNQQCPQVWQQSTCLQVIGEMAEVVRTLQLTRAVVLAANMPKLNEHLKTVSTRLEGFKHYYEKAEPLWPWEHLINANIVKAKDEIVDGNLQGYRDPVAYQWLVIHPTTALQYVHDQDARFKPAVIVDVLGYNVLDWEEGGGDLRSYGASAIVSLSAFEGKTDVGWGLRFFHNKTYSFGITKNSDQLGLFFSVGAVEKVNGWQNRKNEFMASYESIVSQF